VRVGGHGCRRRLRAKLAAETEESRAEADERLRSAQDALAAAATEAQQTRADAQRDAAAIRDDAEAAAAQADERGRHRLAEAEQGAKALRDQVAQHVLTQQRAADDELRRARTEGAALVAAARAEADELRSQARRIVEDARAEVAALARRRDGITQELGQLSGVIQALAVPTPTQPPTAQEPDQ